MMIIYAEIDNALHFDDYKRIIDLALKWPWKETHFVIAENCFGCGINTRYISPPHFSMNMNLEDILYLLQNPQFWCYNCKYCVYDHFPRDECIFCAI
ncbi:unnamed protein product [Diatraea saccharalis]|uniref:Uncharacterized protein n=1 Tax=Diatraea saccharalis TaxID=40085 RepID=A0A9N9R4W5_9NEOP|nr:unnamed protein product [Diatraea saccharalis]